MPERIQRKRTLGWRMPEGAVYVGRPTRWGNPFVVDTYGDGEWQVFRSEVGPILGAFHQKSNALAASAIVFRDWLTTSNSRVSGFHRDEHRDIWASIDQLRGRDLACWCPLDQPCHADVLLELANREAS